MQLDKDTALCISLAARPSSVGTRFHNYLYAELGLNFVYKACTTTDLGDAIKGIRALGIRGCGVSMPFKEDCIPMLDGLDPSAEAIGSVNTIVATDGRLWGYNTDYLAIAALLVEHGVAIDSTVAVLGSGGMAKAAVAAVRDHGFPAGIVVARNAVTGSKLAEQYGFDWVAGLSDQRPSVLINATPIGMSGGPAAHELPVSREVVAAADTVFDVVAMPSETPLIRLARDLGRRVITGAEVSTGQAAEQFVRYTGLRPSADQIARAGEHARA